MNLINGYRCDPCSGLVYGKRLQRAIGRINGRGYVEISSSGMVGLAHRMIWESVHGQIQAGLQINHINGIKTDNRIVNLELVTGSQNTAHAYQLGLRRADGESNGRARLNRIQVLSIRKRVLNGEHKRALAREFGVGPATIRDAVSGRNWSHI